jgi:hypothetical protein
VDDDDPIERSLALRKKAGGLTEVVGEAKPASKPAEAKPASKPKPVAAKPEEAKKPAAKPKETAAPVAAAPKVMKGKGTKKPEEEAQSEEVKLDDIVIEDKPEGATEEDPTAHSPEQPQAVIGSESHEEFKVDVPEVEESALPGDPKPVAEVTPPVVESKGRSNLMEELA